VMSIAFGIIAKRLCDKKIVCRPPSWSFPLQPHRSTLYPRESDQDRILQRCRIVRQATRLVFDPAVICNDLPQPAPARPALKSHHGAGDAVCLTNLSASHSSSEHANISATHFSVRPGPQAPADNPVNGQNLPRPLCCTGLRPAKWQITSFFSREFTEPAQETAVPGRPGRKGAPLFLPAG